MTGAIGAGVLVTIYGLYVATPNPQAVPMLACRAHLLTGCSSVGGADGRAGLACSK